MLAERWLREVWLAEYLPRLTLSLSLTAMELASCNASSSSYSSRKKRKLPSVASESALDRRCAKALTLLGMLSDTGPAYISSVAISL